jgi:hypothetical protein
MSHLSDDIVRGFEPGEFNAAGLAYIACIQPKARDSNAI